ncbi:MAG: glycosyltransferase [Fuerstiella sp.]
MDGSSQPASLVVFSDDWGRHPSSCQHLVKQLLPSYRVLWVNTIGTRAPRMDMATFRRVREKVRQWSISEPRPDDTDAVDLHHNLRVVNPRMWPWFSKSYDRRLNAFLLNRQLTSLVEALPQPVTAITTLPITADLCGRLPVSKWLYYCVDDFGEWPGLDGDTLRLMDVQMIRKADEIVAVSQTLQRFIASQGRQSRLLTHGVDLNYWEDGAAGGDQSAALPDKLEGPLVVFWGVVDQRLNIDMLIALSQRMQQGNIVLVGPQQDPDERLQNLPNVHLIGSRPFQSLPYIADRADVLVMPYADLPVTRAMQPLKMKEYLATGKPVVVSRLPAVEEWQDCLDICQDPEEFAATVMRRIQSDVSTDQQIARQRLQNESWKSKAGELQQSLRVNCPETAE